MKFLFNSKGKLAFMILVPQTGVQGSKFIQMIKIYAFIKVVSSKGQKTKLTYIVYMCLYMYTHTQPERQSIVVS